MTKRIAQVNELIRAKVGRIILEELDMPTSSFATIIKVDTATDLKNSTIYISVMPDNRSQSTFKYIFSNRNRIQHLLAQQLSMKFTPKIHFKLDYTERAAAKIEEVLDNLS